jgi:aldose 1-epimerase
MGDDKLPTVRKPDAGLDMDCASLAVDHCYDGWDGTVELVDERLRVRVRSELTRLVVFTEPTRDSLAVEPVSHVNNAVHLYAAGASAADLGLRILAPGETIVAQMAIEAEAVR